jgi:hypothetical protein
MLSVTFAEGVRQRIKFPRGRTSTVISNAVLRDEIDQYILNARAGQKMKVDISSVENNASFQITRPDKIQLLPGAGWDDDAKTLERRIAGHRRLHYRSGADAR